jgi:hypothetical protein
MRRHLDQETELEANAPEAVLDLKDEHMPAFQARVPEPDEESSTQRKPSLSLA